MAARSALDRQVRVCPVEFENAHADEPRDDLRFIVCWGFGYGMPNVFELYDKTLGGKTARLGVGAYFADQRFDFPARQRMVRRVKCQRRSQHSTGGSVEGLRGGSANCLRYGD